jgi:hypothetical protein
MSHHSWSARCFERFKASSFMSLTVFDLAGTDAVCRSSATERPVSSSKRRRVSTARKAGKLSRPGAPFKERLSAGRCRVALAQEHAL